MTITVVAVLMMVMMVVAAMTDFGQKTVMHLAIDTVLMMAMIVMEVTMMTAMIVMAVTMMMVKMLHSRTTGTIKPAPQESTHKCVKILPQLVGWVNLFNRVYL